VKLNGRQCFSRSEKLANEVFRKAKNWGNNDAAAVLNYLAMWFGLLA
jgi:hypothetical protein